jgi:hypothetical protein
VKPLKETAAIRRFKLTNKAMDNWQAAYRAANGREAPRITYSDGWFRFDLMNGVRLSQLEKMTATLMKNAAELQKDIK